LKNCVAPCAASNRRAASNNHLCRPANHVVTSHAAMNRAVIIATKINGAKNRNVRRRSHANPLLKHPSRRQPSRAASNRTRLEFFSAP